MNKIVSVMVIGSMAASLIACGGSPSDESSEQSGQAEAAEWTREGYFQNENGDFLSVTYYDDEDDEGWYVGCMIGDDSYGNILEDEGGKLHGNLIPDYEEGEFIVTVSEEGENGLKMEVEGGETYLFTVMDTSGDEAAIIVAINTEGLGYVSYVRGDDEEEPEEDALNTSVQINLTEPETIRINAVADEDWEFVKWTKDGEDYSTEQQLTEECTESAVYVAVFEPADE